MLWLPGWKPKQNSSLEWKRWGSETCQHKKQPLCIEEETEGQIDPAIVR